MLLLRPDFSRAAFFAASTRTIARTQVEVLPVHRPKPPVLRGPGARRKCRRMRLGRSFLEQLAHGGPCSQLLGGVEHNGCLSRASRTELAARDVGPQFRRHEGARTSGSNKCSRTPLGGVAAVGPKTSAKDWHCVSTDVTREQADVVSYQDEAGAGFCARTRRRGETLRKWPLPHIACRHLGGDHRWQHEQREKRGNARRD